MSAFVNQRLPSLCIQLFRQLNLKQVLPKLVQPAHTEYLCNSPKIQDAPCACTNKDTFQSSLKALGQKRCQCNFKPLGKPSNFVRAQFWHTSHKGEPWLVFANCLCTFPLQPTSLPREFIKQCKKNCKIYCLLC